MELISNFTVVGKLLGFILKDGYKIKFLKLELNQQEYWFKLDKDLRKNLDPRIIPGCMVEIAGTRQLCAKTGTLKLKAYDLKPANTHLTTVESPQAKPETKAETKAAKTTILMCQKSDCWKRGGKAVCEALQATLSDRGLDEAVQIKTTGCMKECKQGPNLVVMPDKARYSRIQPEQIPMLIEKHFTVNA